MKAQFLCGWRVGGEGTQRPRLPWRTSLVLVPKGLGRGFLGLWACVVNTPKVACVCVLSLPHSITRTWLVGKCVPVPGVLFTGSHSPMTMCFVNHPV